MAGERDVAEALADAMPSPDPRARPMMATVNEEIDRLHASLHLADSDFFCECGHSGCRERMTLTRAEYARLADESRPLIAPQHAEREGAAATELHELRGQVHQLEGTLASRVDIEQAKGVLVERLGLSPAAAFEALRRRARDERVSLAAVCAEVIDQAGPAAEPVDPTPAAALRPGGEPRGR